jgi:hypothetical protein
MGKVRFAEDVPIEEIKRRILWICKKSRDLKELDAYLAELNYRRNVFKQDVRGEMVKPSPVGGLKKIVREMVRGGGE